MGNGPELTCEALVPDAFLTVVDTATPLAPLPDGPAEPDPVAMTDIDELGLTEAAGVVVIEVTSPVGDPVGAKAVEEPVIRSLSALSTATVLLAVALIVLNQNPRESIANCVVRYER